MKPYFVCVQLSSCIRHRFTMVFDHHRNTTAADSRKCHLHLGTMANPLNLFRQQIGWMLLKLRQYDSNLLLVWCQYENAKWMAWNGLFKFSWIWNGVDICHVFSKFSIHFIYEITDFHAQISDLTANFRIIATNDDDFTFLPHTISFSLHNAYYLNCNNFSFTFFSRSFASCAFKCAWRRLYMYIRYTCSVKISLLECNTWMFKHTNEVNANCRRRKKYKNTKNSILFFSS